MHDCHVISEILEFAWSAGSSFPYLVDCLYGERRGFALRGLVDPNASRKGPDEHVGNRIHDHQASKLGSSA